jgi:hypothetical protein
MMCWLSNRLVTQLAVLTRPIRRLHHLPTPGCQGNSFSMGYVEDCFDLRTPLEGCLSSRQVVTC